MTRRRTRTSLRGPVRFPRDLQGCVPAQKGLEGSSNRGGCQCLFLASWASPDFTGLGERAGAAGRGLSRPQESVPRSQDTKEGVSLSPGLQPAAHRVVGNPTTLPATGMGRRPWWGQAGLEPPPPQGSGPLPGRQGEGQDSTAVPISRQRDQQLECHLIYMTKWHHYCELTECRWGNFRNYLNNVMS